MPRIPGLFGSDTSGAVLSNFVNFSQRYRQFRDYYQQTSAIYERIAENDRRMAEGERQRGARNRQRALAGDALSGGLRGTLLTPLLGAIGQDEQKTGLLGL